MVTEQEYVVSDKCIFNKTVGDSHLERLFSAHLNECDDVESFGQLDQRIGFKIDYVDTVTMYLGKSNQVPYYDTILKLNPRRIIFNPGTKNVEFEQLANKNGIEVIEACTLVMLSIGEY